MDPLPCSPITTLFTPLAHVIKNSPKNRHFCFKTKKILSTGKRSYDLCNISFKLGVKFLTGLGLTNGIFCPSALKLISVCRSINTHNLQSGTETREANGLLPEPEAEGAWRLASRRCSNALEKEQIRLSSRRAYGPEGCQVDLRQARSVKTSDKTSKHLIKLFVRFDLVIHYGY